MNTLHGSFLLLTALVVACAEPAADAETSHAESAETAGASTIAFHADGTVRHDATIAVGRPLVVTYDVRRLASCGVLREGSPSGAQLELFFMTRNGHAHVALGGEWADPEQRTTARATLGPFGAHDAGDLQIWFRASNASGCEAWDSAHGHNYHFAIGEVAAPPSYATIAPLIHHACARCHHDQFGSLDRVKTERAAMSALISEGVMPRDNPGWKDTADGQLVLDFLSRSPELR